MRSLPRKMVVTKDYSHLYMCHAREVTSSATFLRCLLQFSEGHMFSGQWILRLEKDFLSTVPLNSTHACICSMSTRAFSSVCDQNCTIASLVYVSIPKLPQNTHFHCRASICKLLLCLMCYLQSSRFTLWFILHCGSSTCYIALSCTPL